MRRTSILGLVLAGAFLVSGPAGSALAQAPGGNPGSNPGSNPGAPSHSIPSQDSRNSELNTSAGGGSTGSKSDDKKFAKQAAIGGLTEVELGKLALQKSSNADVKQFAQKMVDDHSKANDELKKVATQENLDIPTALDSKHQSRLDKLAKLSGDDFDKAYIKDQLKDHEMDVRDFSSEAQKGTDPNVKAFASTTLPTLQEHLQMVKNLSKSGK